MRPPAEAATSARPSASARLARKRSPPESVPALRTRSPRSRSTTASGSGSFPEKRYAPRVSCASRAEAPVARRSRKRSSRKRGNRLACRSVATFPWRSEEARAARSSAASRRPRAAAASTAASAPRASARARSPAARAAGTSPGSATPSGRPRSAMAARAASARPAQISASARAAAAARSPGVGELLGGGQRIVGPRRRAQPVREPRRRRAQLAQLARLDGRPGPAGRVGRAGGRGQGVAGLGAGALQPGQLGHRGAEGRRRVVAHAPRTEARRQRRRLGGLLLAPAAARLDLALARRQLARLGLGPPLGPLGLARQAVGLGAQGGRVARRVGLVGQGQGAVRGGPRARGGAGLGGQPRDLGRRRRERGLGGLGRPGGRVEGRRLGSRTVPDRAAADRARVAGLEPGPQRRRGVGPVRAVQMGPGRVGGLAGRAQGLLRGLRPARRGGLGAGGGLGLGGRGGPALGGGRAGQQLLPPGPALVHQRAQGRQGLAPRGELAGLALQGLAGARLGRAQVAQALGRAGQGRQLGRAAAVARALGVAPGLGRGQGGVGARQLALGRRDRRLDRGPPARQLGPPVGPGQRGQGRRQRLGPGPGRRLGDAGRLGPPRQRAQRPGQRPPGRRRAGGSRGPRPRGRRVGRQRLALARQHVGLGRGRRLRRLRRDPRALERRHVEQLAQDVVARPRRRAQELGEPALRQQHRAGEGAEGQPHDRPGRLADRRLAHDPGLDRAVLVERLQQVARLGRLLAEAAGDPVAAPVLGEGEPHLAVGPPQREQLLRAGLLRRAAVEREADRVEQRGLAGAGVAGDHHQPQPRQVDGLLVVGAEAGQAQLERAHQAASSACASAAAKAAAWRGSSGWPRRAYQSA